VGWIAGVKANSALIFFLSFFHQGKKDKEQQKLP
jgi:hypothetical protein